MLNDFMTAVTEGCLPQCGYKEYIRKLAVAGLAAVANLIGFDLTKERN